MKLNSLMGGLREWTRKLITWMMVDGDNEFYMKTDGEIGRAHV